MAIGRISGQLLKANLLRDGVDLAFETDLLYLDVVNSRIGVNKLVPTTALDVNGTTRTTNLVVDDHLDIGVFHITGNTITSDNDTFAFQPSGSEATIYHSKLQVDDFHISGNTISTTVSNSSIELRPNGSGVIELFGNTNVTGNLYVTGNTNVTGNVTIGGNITIGDALTDTVVINASIRSDLVPELTNSYDIGTDEFRWKSVYVHNFHTETMTLPELYAGSLIFRNNEITTTAATDLYIDGNGVGGVRLGNFRIVDNILTNIVPNVVSEINQIGAGYFKISGTNGFVPPLGNTIERPTDYAVVGMTRYNTLTAAMEIWDGFSWASPAGSSGAVSTYAANDISAAMAFALG